MANVQNSGSEQSTVKAAIPLSFSSGDSHYAMNINMSGDIALESSTGQNIKLGTAAQLVYSESAAAAVGNGGFKTTTADGEYIYGSLANAISASSDGYVDCLMIILDLIL